MFDLIYTDPSGARFDFSKYSVRRLAKIWAFCPGIAADIAEAALRRRGWIDQDFDLIEEVLLEDS